MKNKISSQTNTKNLKVKKSSNFFVKSFSFGMIFLFVIISLYLPQSPFSNIERVLAASPTVGNFGNEVAGTAAITPVWPAHVSGDVALLFVETANQAVTLSTPAGFTEIPTAQGLGTGAAIGATRITVFWNRATSGSMANPVVADSGDHQYARIVTFKGVIDSGNPYDVVAGSTKTPASTTTTFNTVTTTVDDALVVLAAAVDRDSATESFSNWVNANLTGISEVIDYGTTTGVGGGISVAVGTKLTAGATGTTTGTLISSITAQMTIALKPAGSLVAPTVTTTTPVTNVTGTTATGGGNVTSNGGATVTTSGLVWSTSIDPTIALSTKTTDGWADPGLWTSGMTGLTKNTLYYVRAYATNSVGTSYGANVQFTTLIEPTVTTQAVTSIAGTTATGNGNVTNDGGGTITERGVVWNTLTDPTTSNGKATASGTTGVFTANISGLTKNTLYYVRAYAINSAGTSYGGNVTFTTLIEPTVSTVSASEIAETTAVANSNITNTGGGSVDIRGVVYDIAPHANPGNVAPASSLYPSKVEETGSFSTGAFSSNLINLTEEVTYYFRSYAHNSVGYYYGDEISFTTLAATPEGMPISGTLTSSVFDTANSSSIGYNSIMWKGTLGGEGKVRFQFASSATSTGPWNFYGGSTCVSGDWLDPLGPETPIEIKEGSGCLGAWNNKRYFRYKVQICSKDCVEAGLSTPVVDSIVVNWSL